MKKVFLFCLIVIGLFIITGCGNKLSEYAGIYKLEYSKFVGDPDTAKDTSEVAEITLNADGTGKSVRDGLNIDIEWKLDGENITLTEIYMGIKLDYNGTLKNNKLDIFNGDKTNQLTVEKVYIKE
jgi:hypothetical protein